MFRISLSNINIIEEMLHTFYGCASITNSQRPDIVKKEVSPDPGAYNPIMKDTKQIPFWILKPKIQYTSCFHNKNPGIPAPGAYNISPQNKQGQKNKNKNQKIIKYKQRGYVQRSSPVIALNLPSFVDQKSGFTFGYRDDIVVHQKSPGPIYHVDELKQQARQKKFFNSSIGFGLGSRNKTQKQECPGPGSYEPSPDKLYAKSGKWTFSKSQRKNKPIYENPNGPGQYNTNFSSTSRSFVFKGRHIQQKSDRNEISPFSYKLPSTQSKRSAIFNYSSQKNNNNENQTEYPSPFTYNPLNSTLKAGGFSLGKKLNDIDQNVQNPGPGSYQLNNGKGLFAKTGGFISKKQRQKKKLIQEAEDIHKYKPNFETVTYKYPQYSFKQSSTSVKQKQNTIGPGTYNILRSSGGQSYSISKNIRFKPLLKQKPYANFQLSQTKYASSFGNLPSYLLKRKKQVYQSQPIVRQKGKQELKENDQNKQN